MTNPRVNTAAPKIMRNPRVNLIAITLVLLVAVTCNPPPAQF
jgi:hypothetical protein